MYIECNGVYCESLSEYFENLNVIYINTLNICFDNSLRKNVSYNSLMLRKEKGDLEIENVDLQESCIYNTPSVFIYKHPLPLIKGCLYIGTEMTQPFYI